VKNLITSIERIPEFSLTDTGPVHWGARAGPRPPNPSHPHRLTVEQGRPILTAVNQFPSVTPA